MYSIPQQACICVSFSKCGYICLPYSGFAFLIGAIFDQVTLADVVNTPLVIILVAFGGLYINERSFTRGGAWVKYISFVRFFWYGFSYNEFEGQTGYTCEGLSSSPGSCQ